MPPKPKHRCITPGQWADWLFMSTIIGSFLILNAYWWVLGVYTWGTKYGR